MSVHTTKRTQRFSPWESCQIRKIAGCACAGNAGNVFPATVGKRSRHATRHVRDVRAVMHAGIANPWFTLKSVAFLAYAQCAILRIWLEVHWSGDASIYSLWACDDIWFNQSCLTLVWAMGCNLFGTKQMMWTNTELLSIGPVGIKFCEISTQIQTSSLKKLYFKMPPAKLFKCIFFDGKFKFTSKCPKAWVIPERVPLRFDFFLILTCHCKANIGHCLGVKGSRFTQILANTYSCGFGDTQRNLKVKMESSNEKFLTAVTDG